MRAGASRVDTIMQVISAVGIGVILGLSTYDHITCIIAGVVGIVIGAFLIRKSVRADIVEVWKERWNKE